MPLVYQRSVSEIDADVYYRAYELLVLSLLLDRSRCGFLFAGIEDQECGYCEPDKQHGANHQERCLFRRHVRGSINMNMAGVSDSSKIHIFSIDEYSLTLRNTDTPGAQLRCRNPRTP
jgi:hypothetical protein